MAYRAPRISVEYAKDFCVKIDGEINTYLPACEREDVRQSPLAKHFRMNTKTKALLVRFGYEIWEDLYNVTVQELEATRVLDRAGILDLVEYAHRISILKSDDVVSDVYLERILNTNISNSDLIVYESQISSVRYFLQSPVYSWTETEQKVFCRKFFANEQPHRLAKDVGLTVGEVGDLYARLLGDFRELAFLGDLIEILQNEKYKVLSRWRLMRDFPEFDIRPFNKFPNYRSLDLVVAIMQIREYGESILDLSWGDVGKTVLKQLKGTLMPINGAVEKHSSLMSIEPSLVDEYLTILGFKFNHLYRAFPAMEQSDILISYLKLLGRPVKRHEFRADLAGLLDSRSMNQKIIDTHGVVIPITKSEYALREWGFEPFLGAGEVISEYIKENGPTHIEMIFAILDGYGFSQKRIKDIASQPPFALIDDVCFLMLDEIVE
jgi:hypothetical protein